MYCLSTARTQYLCGFTLDYYNATPTKNGNPFSKESGFLILHYSFLIIIERF